MPTYQYACTEPSCANRFELVQSFTDPAASECPVCGGPVRKVYGSVGVVFKGSGFYRTDSRSAANGKATTSESKSDSKSESKSDSKSEGAAKSDSTSKSESKSASAPTTPAAAAS